MDRQSQLSLPGVAPGGVPQEAVEYLLAVRHYYRPGITRPPTNADIAADLHIPLRTWDNHKRDLRGRRWGRDYIEVWPPPPDWQPTWEPLIGSNGKPQSDGVGLRVVREAAVDEQQRPVLIEELFAADGRSLSRRLVERLPALAACLIGAAVMDIVSDGRLDGIVRFVRMCMQGRIV